MTGILLARRDGTAFVASPPERTDPRRNTHETARDVVMIPVSEAEFQSAGLLPGRVAAWPPAAQRPDLLATMVSSLLTTEGAELRIQTSHEGSTFCALTRDGARDNVVVAPADVLGLLASLFHCAPRGIIGVGASPAERLLIAIRPGQGPGSFRARIASAAAAPPADLTAAGVSTALMNCLLQALTGGPGILLVAGTAGSGRSTTLALLASALTARGMKGLSLGLPSGPDGLMRLSQPWPFLDALPSDPWDFIVIDTPEAMDYALAARIASTGRPVLASCGPGDAAATSAYVARLLQSAGAPEVPVSVLAQDLVRQVCADCSQWVSLPPEQVSRIGFHPTDIAGFQKHGGVTVPQGQRCARCRATGTMGLMGVFAYAGPRDPDGALPRMREDGWSKVFSGQALYEDVMALTGAQTPMRPMPSVSTAAAAHPSAPQQPPPVPARPELRPQLRVQRPVAPAASIPTPRVAAPAATVRAQEIEDPLEEPLGMIAEAPEQDDAELPRSDDAVQEPEEIGPPPGSALTDADAWATLLNEARSRDGDAAPLEKLIATLARRASGQEPLLELLAPSRGLHLARHTVNTALLAVRIGREMSPPPDPRALARLGLLHDVGIASVGIDFATDLPATVSKESLDQSGSRMSPGIVLSTLGVEDPGLEEAIRCVHRTASSKDHAPEKDPVIQIVGLASLLEMNSRGSGPSRPRDVHDATAVVLERHARAFGRDVFRALMMAVPIYPVGCRVELSSGDFGRVVSLNTVNYFRPRVEIRVTGGGRGLPERRVIDLARAPFLHIRHRVAESDAAASAAR